MTYVLTAKHFAGSTDVYTFDGEADAEKAAANLRFRGATTEVVEAQEFVADDSKRFVVCVNDPAPDKCYGIFETREQAEGAEATLKQNDEAKASEVFEITQAQAEDWTIAAMPE